MFKKKNILKVVFYDKEYKASRDFNGRRSHVQDFP